MRFRDELQIGTSLFITHLSSTPANTPQAPVRVPHALVDVHDITDEAGLRNAVHQLASALGYHVDTDAWNHDMDSHEGCVLLRPSRESESGSPTLVVTWGYDALDDIDMATDVRLPIDHRGHAYGSLTPEQVATFWEHVTDELQPFELFDDLVRRMGMTPREHDQQDVWVMQYVLALQWWRAYPTVEAGEHVLTLGPELTNAVVAQVSLMASRCFLEGQNYELADVLVYP